MLGPPSRVGRGLETEPLARCTFQTQTPGPSPPTPPGWAHSLPCPAGLGEQGRPRSHHPHQRVLSRLPLPRLFLPGEGSYLFLSPVLPRVALSGKASPLLSGTVRNCSGLTTGKPRFFYQNTVSDTIPRPPHCVCCGKPALPVSTLWRRHTPPLSPQGASQTPVYSRGPGSTPNAGAGDVRPQCPAPHGAAPATESRLRAPWDPPMTCNLALCVSQGSRGRSSRRE